MKRKIKLNDLKQSKLMTLTEQFANVGSGMIIAFTLSQIAAHYESTIQYYLWSGFHWQVAPGSNAVMTVILTVVSILRGYCWRRAFSHRQASDLYNQLKEAKK